MSEPENYRRLALETRERAAANSGILREVLLRVADTYDAMARVQKTFDHPPEQDEPAAVPDDPTTAPSDEPTTAPQEPATEPHYESSTER